MSEPRKFEISELDLKTLADAFLKLKPLLDLVMSNEDTKGICALEGCGQPFVKREAKQRFCCPAHQVQAWNKSRRVKKVADAIGDAPMVKCQVQGCENIFQLDMSRPFPYRCLSCAEKSV